MFQITFCISEVAKIFASSPLGSHLSKMLVNQQSTRSWRSTGHLTALTSEVSLNAISNFLSKDYGIQLEHYFLALDLCCLVVAKARHIAFKVETTLLRNCLSAKGHYENCPNYFLELQTFLFTSFVFKIAAIPQKYLQNLTNIERVRLHQFRKLNQTSMR